MTDCITKPITLSSLRRQKVLVEFDGGKITSDAGALLLREADQSRNLVKRISDCIPDPHDPDCIEHQQATMIAQRVMAIATAAGKTSMTISVCVRIPFGRL